MTVKCAPGDLAVIVEAFNQVNIGSIVRVVAYHPDQSALLVPATDVLWTCQATRWLTYDVDGVKKRRHKGPVPDSGLHPIRGEPKIHEIELMIDLITSRAQVGDTAVEVLDRPTSFL